MIRGVLVFGSIVGLVCPPSLIEASTRSTRETSRSPTIEIAPGSLVRLANSSEKKKKKKKKKKRRRRRKKTPPPPAVSVEEVTEVEPSASGSNDPSTLLSEAREAELDLDYDRVLELAERIQVLESATREQLNAALVLQATALIINGRQIDAEIPFTKVMRSDIDFELPESTPPKIMAVFRKVQVEERQAYAARRAAERQSLIDTLSLAGGPIEEAEGGKPLPFSFVVGDPNDAVRQVNVMYRRQGEPAYSSLALARAGTDGTWTGELPGEWTSSEIDFTVDYFVQTLDQSDRPLLTSGQANAPRQLKVAAGVFEPSVPFYRTTWFWSATAGALLLSGIAGFIAYREATALPESDLEPLEIQ